MYGGICSPGAAGPTPGDAAADDAAVDAADDVTGRIYGDLPMGTF